MARWNGIRYVPACAPRIYAGLRTMELFGGCEFETGARCRVPASSDGDGHVRFTCRPCAAADGMAHTPSQRYESGSTLSVYLSDFLGQLSLSCMLIRNHVQYKRIWVPENISRWKTLLSMPTYLPRRLEYFRLQYIGYIFQLESHFNFIQTVSY